jgi:hypothetical protein
VDESLVTTFCQQLIPGGVVYFSHFDYFLHLFPFVVVAGVFQIRLLPMGLIDARPVLSTATADQQV